MPQKRLAAVCGLLCPACPVFIGTKEDPGKTCSAHGGRVAMQRMPVVPAMRVCGQTQAGHRAVFEEAMIKDAPNGVAASNNNMKITMWVLS
jgi:hypothetical protein